MLGRMTLHATATPAATPTRTGEILDAAERLVQTRGFNAFSYADIAAELGISKAALHYHFPSKEALGDALIRRYSERFFHELEVIEATEPDARARLSAYVQLYRGVLSTSRMCLCGMLAAEYQTLPAGMRAAVLEFFRRNEIWLEAVLRQGVARREIAVAEPLGEAAKLIIDTLEGAMMISRAHDDPQRFEHASARLLAGLTD
jgi:TetR/AcrR family transcriptional regulator, transcriptional repressor for nem operon